MFESAMMEANATKSRLLTVAAMGGQLAVVSLVVLLPLLSPSVIQTFTKQNNIPLVPLRPLAKVESVERSSASSVAQPLVTITQITRRRLVAPSVINPVVQFIDETMSLIAKKDPGPYVPANGPLLGSPLGTLVDKPPPPVPVAKPRVEPDRAGPAEIGGKVQEAKLIKRVMPVYPAIARQGRIQGKVSLQGIIAKDGTIQHLQVMFGHPVLVPAAVEAVRQWVYAPTHLNGKAVEVICPIDVIFTLSQ